MELWEKVFYWATFSDIRKNLSSDLVHIDPFASGYGFRPYDQERKVLSVKCSLSLVCSSWRTLSLPFLLEDIWIHIRGVRALETVLEREFDRDGKRLGSLVRCARVRLYRAGTGIDSYCKTIVSPRTGRILSLCRDIRLLVTLPGVLPVEKHKTGNTHYPADVAFRDLYMPKLVFAELNGCMAVPDFVVRALNLQYLSIQDDVTWGTAGLRGKIRILEVEGRALLHSMSHIGRPALDKLIVRLSVQTAAWFSNPPFAFVRCLDLRFMDGFPRSYLIRFISKLPDIESLYYPVMKLNRFQHREVDPERPPVPFPKLQTIGLRDEAKSTNTRDTNFAIRHIKWLGDLEATFPGLKEVVLYGSTWSEHCRKPEFNKIMKFLAGKGVSITYG